MKMTLISTFLLMIFLSSLNAQGKFENTLSYDEALGSPTANIADLEWIAGHWTGKAFGGTVEEIWSPPLGGSMMATFKLVVDNQVAFYEIETISEMDGSLILRLKHFNDQLVGWEEKEETVDFKLVGMSDDAVYFDGFTFKRISADHMDVYVRIREGETAEEMKFSYHK